MRKIEFRGKSLHEGEWVYGSLVVNYGRTYIAPEKNGIELVKVDKDTVGMNTGLFDGTKWDDLTGDEQSDECFKYCGGDHEGGYFTTRDNWKGFPIFEGDLLKDQPIEVDGKLRCGYYPVVWNEKEACWSADWSFHRDGCYLVPLHTDLNDHMVMGNIHDNPELITVSKLRPSAKNQ